MEEQMKSVFDIAPSGYFTLSKEGKINSLNLAACLMLGLDRSRLINSMLGTYITNNSKPVFNLFLNNIFINKTKETCEVTLSLQDSTHIHVLLTGIETENECLVTAVDITDRKIAEKYREMSRLILQILNEPGDIADLIQEVFAVLKSGTGFDAVGIRLQKGDDYPYIAHNGFSTNFILAENSLIERNSDNGVCRDKNGNVCLECTCGMVILGKRSKLNPPLTPGGSWWTNDTLPLLEIPPCEDARHNPRNRCTYLRYASMALIPIRANEKNIGLLQFNDTHKGCFTHAMVEKLEGIASHIGSALARKQTEETLRESEKHRLAIIEAAMDGFWLVDLQGFLVEVNETYCQMSGYTKQELLGKHISDLEAVESAETTADRIKKVISQGYDRFESRHFRKDGSIFDVEISTRYQSNRDKGLVAFLHDITERKFAEEKLRQSEERYKSLFKHNHSVMLLIDPDNGKIKDANPAACNFYGWSYSELCGKNISDIDPLPKEDTASKLQNSKRNKSNHLFLTHILADGRARDVEIYSGPIKFGDSLLLFSIIHDITSRKQAEKAKEENERQLLESQSLAHIGSYAVDLVTRTWTASPEIYKIFGIDKSHLHTLDAWASVIHPDFQYQLIDYFAQVEVEKIGFDQEYKIIRVNDCMERWVLGLGILEYDNQENPVRLIGTIQDITERKLAEQAIIQLNRELENRVKERTAELINSNVFLQQTEEKYRTVADYTYDWEYWISEEDNINYMSPSVERITGYSVEEFLTNRQLLTQIVFSDDLGLWISHKEETHKPDPNKKNDDIEFRIVSKTGEIHWIGHVCKGIFIDGKYKGLRVSNRDITEKVKAENELLNVTVEVEERERNRFSLELHDDLGPLLSTIKLYFQWLSETDNPKKKIIITEKGNKSIDQAIQTTREIAHGLGSHILENSGYVKAMLLFTQSINETRKIIIGFNSNSSKRFNYLLEITLYRITTELINNTLKYSGATHVEIVYNFFKEKNILIFTYVDNGIGFDLDVIEKKSKGLGLLNIKHRIKLVSGTVKIESGIGKGMRVYIELPV
ncbi:MAG: PAS domain S-box protein [Prolixibacteraceae bacterium]